MRSFTVILFLAFAAPHVAAFVAPHPPHFADKSLTELGMAHRSRAGRSSPRTGRTDRSKRQERVGHLVRCELATIIHRGTLKGNADYLDDRLRQRISVLSADVSPDLRQARITVSIGRGKDQEKSERSNVASDRHRAFSWLVNNAKPLRHSLARRMDHMKTSPNLSFVLADVEAAVDVMYLIDKVAAGYEREHLGQYGGDDDSLPRGMVDGLDFDLDDDDEWDDEDDDFFLEMP